MENQITEAITPTLSEIAAQAAQAMKDAAAEYGPEAMDLGLLVVRVGAAQDLLSSFLIAVIMAVVAYFLWQGSRYYANKHKARDYERGEDPAFAAGMLLVLSVGPAGLALGFAIDLLNIFKWAAVFGYPEILITAKALKAVGLM